MPVKHSKRCRRARVLMKKFGNGSDDKVWDITNCRACLLGLLRQLAWGKNYELY